MSAAIFIPSSPQFAGVVLVPASRGPMCPNHGVAVSRGRLPTDAVGTCALTIQNAVVGSRYRIEVASTGALVAEGDMAAADFSVSVPYYAVGNASNTLRIKVRKGTTAPKYQPFQTQVTAGPSGALAYISQVPDPIA